MVIKKEVRDALKQKFNNISKRRIDQIIVGKQKEYGIVNRDIAGYVLAFENGIKLTKYLGPEIIQKVQDAMQKGPKIIETGKIKNSRAIMQSPIIKIGKGFDIDHPVLSSKIVVEAQKMSEVYPFIYVFENSVRNVIQTIMEKKYGKNWWNDKVSERIKKIVSGRMEKENKNKWHGRRGAHQIFYSDIDHLSDIITTYWKDFEPYFPSQPWVKAKIEIIETSRNVVSHNNPLSEDDIASVKLNFKQWTKQLKDFKIDSP